jgi:assimilatory nitrate reductase catalytic subunit
VRALISARQKPGSIFVPMHWSNEFTSRARIDTLVPGLIDAVSGQPAFKNVAARIERFQAAMFGFAVLRQKPIGMDAEYWAIARCNGGWRVELAFASGGRDWAAFAASLAPTGHHIEMLSYSDADTGRRRYACYAGGQLMAALYLAPDPVAVARDWAIDELAIRHSSRRSRLSALAGRPGRGAQDRGRIVCSCFSVGANEIAAAAAQGCSTVVAVGQAISAGTNCGSCRGEIRAIIDAQRPVLEITQQAPRWNADTP